MIGVGGMGAVWSSLDRTTGREVAVKFLHPTLLNDPLTVQRFLQEGEVGRQLRHPFIVETLSAGRHETADGKEPLPYLVTELLDGESLSDVIRRLSRLPVGPALTLVSHVAEAVEAAHQAGVLHRDIKPANVFLHRERDGSVAPKVLDFGISKLLDPLLDVGLTTTGMLVGSPMYVSPEQALGKRDIDGRSDVWSIGVMLHRILTGEPLFSQSGTAVLSQIVGKDVTLDHMAGFPQPVVDIVWRCLRRDRTQRFARAADLAHALDEATRALGLSPDLRGLLPALPPSSATLAATQVLPQEARDALARASLAAAPPEPPTVASPPPVHDVDVTKTPLSATTPLPADQGRSKWTLPSVGIGVGLALLLGFLVLPSQPAVEAPKVAATAPLPAPTPAPTATETTEPAALPPPAPPPIPAASVVPSAHPKPRVLPPPPHGRPPQPAGPTVIHDPGF
jgi:serine/threonine-protein kinase